MHLIILKCSVFCAAVVGLAAVAAWPASALEPALREAAAIEAGPAFDATTAGPQAGRKAPAAISGPAHAPTRSDTTESLPSRPMIDYLWVVRTSLVDRASVDSVIARAKAMGVTGLLVQVVGRGDAYYDSQVLPRAEALEDQPDLDPLGEVVWRAHLAGLEVHAWVNTLLVWSAPGPPRDSRHVVLAHPEWVAKLEDGRPMTELSSEERQRLGVEGAFLAPSHPGVRAWVASIAAEIARRYPVTGIHLDYIRHPKTSVGYDEATRLLYAMRGGLTRSHVRPVPAPQQVAGDDAWLAFRIEQISGVVDAVRDSLDRVRPGVLLSAAVIADSVRAETLSAQAWRHWLRDRLVDRVFPMVYAPRVQTVMDQLASFADALGASDRVVPGIAIFNTAPSRAAMKIVGARELGFPLVALFSYDALFEKPELWGQLRAYLSRNRRAP